MGCLFYWMCCAVWAVSVLIVGIIIRRILRHFDSWFCVKLENVFFGEHVSYFFLDNYNFTIYFQNHGKYLVV